MEREAPLRHAALSLAIACALLILGFLVFALTGGALSVDTVLPAIAVTLGWKVIIWAALLGGLALWRPRIGLYITAAALAAVLDILFSNLGFLRSGVALFLVPGWLLTIVVFTAVAAMGCLLARSLTRGGKRIGAIALALTLTLGGALALSLPSQWFRVYFTIWGPAPEASDADGARYLAAALAALAFSIAGTVIAAVMRRRAFTVLAAVLLALTLVLVFVFQVPQGRWLPSAPEPEPYNSNYVPCFSAGDPGCVGG
jgi:hypothetical protein